MIDYEEFIAATINLSRLEQEAAYQKAFQTFDTDNSGFLTYDEIKEALAVSQPSEFHHPYRHQTIFSNVFLRQQLPRITSVMEVLLFALSFWELCQSSMAKI